MIKSFEEVGINDVEEVGGKNASLGEMIRNLDSLGIDVPGGFVVTAQAYRYFLSQTGLDGFIKEALVGLNTGNLSDLAKRGREIREKIKNTQFPHDLSEAIIKAHQKAKERYGKDADFAVRSSATAEDLPDASFAGEHETFLNVRGREDIIRAVRFAFASLFTDRAISYRQDKGFDHMQIALSVGVQKMVRSDLACSGVMFTLDTESGFPGVVLINGSWGLGEMIVQGEVTPDEFLVFKQTQAIIDKKLGEKERKMVYGQDRPTRVVETSGLERQTFILSDGEIAKLAQWAVAIEDHWSKKRQKWTPMDLEWAKDGKTGRLYIIQARPETVHSSRDYSNYQEYVREEAGTVIVSGSSVGSKIATGKARVITDVGGIRQFKKGEVLVTVMTDPDWEPIMKMAAAIVTDKGGRTSHAAIVARELGIPAVVGCKDATSKINTGETVTVDCTGHEGEVLAGTLRFRVKNINTGQIPKTKCKVMVNIATPQTAFEKSFLPNEGVGLAREEFIIASDIGIHPMALVKYDDLLPHSAHQVDLKTTGYNDKKQFYIDRLAFGIAKIAAAFYPKPVIVRFSDFKTNEYRSLIGGDMFEPKEENPMIGFRGASRYYHPDFEQAFILEVKAVEKVIKTMGLRNVRVMVPFCRTVEEGKKVVKIIEENGLSRKKMPDFKIYVMCEIPANVVLAEQFLEIFDGMSIGSNDLAQLTLGIDRDGNERIRGIANETDQSVKELVAQVIKTCKKLNKYIGICGQAPSDYPEFVEFLVSEGISSISLNPDTVIKTIVAISQLEQKSES